MSLFVDHGSLPSDSEEVNDENQPPPQFFHENLPSPAFSGRTLKSSQRANIPEIFFSPLKPQQGTFPHSPPVRSPPADELLQELDEEEAWRERCIVITRQDHEEYCQHAREIINDLINQLPIRVESHCKPDTLEIINERFDSRSISSTELTPSESSFDTAKEDFDSARTQLPDLLQPEILHDRSDTEYESAQESEDVTEHDSSDPDHNLNIPNFYPENLVQSQFSPCFQDNFVAAAAKFLDREKTPVPSDFKPCREGERELTSTPYSSQIESWLEFDKETTPIRCNFDGATSPTSHTQSQEHLAVFTHVSSSDELAADSEHHSPEVPPEQNACDLVVDNESFQETDNNNILISFNDTYSKPESESHEKSPNDSPDKVENFSQLQSTYDLQASAYYHIAEKSERSEEINASEINNNFTVRKPEASWESLPSLASDNFCEAEPEVACLKNLEDYTFQPIESPKEILANYARNFEHAEPEAEPSLETSVCSLELNETVILSANYIKKLQDLTPEKVTSSDLSDVVVPADQPDSNNAIPEQGTFECLDATFGSVVWQASVDQSLKNTCSDQSLEQNEQPLAQAVDDDELLNSDLQEQIALDASIIAEEFINLSLAEDYQDSQAMKDRMADTENNEQPLPLSGGNNSLDENVNPFEGKRRLPNSPKCAPDVAEITRRLSSGVRNGEVTSKGTTPLKTARRGSSSRSSPATVSPKRKTRDSTGAELDHREGGDGAPSPVEYSPAKDVSLGATPPRMVSDSSLPPSVGSPSIHRTALSSFDVSASPAARNLKENEMGAADSNRALINSPSQLSRGVDAQSGLHNASPKDTRSADVVREELAGRLASPLMVSSVEGDMNKSEAGPDVAEVADSEFRSAVDVFKDPSAFEFLQLAGSKQLSESALARMSLYVKFDPLLKAISPVTRRATVPHEHAACGSSDHSGDLLLMGSPANSEDSAHSEQAHVVEGKLLNLTLTPRKQESSPASDTPQRTYGRIYSEEEFSQALRMQELLFQEQLLTKDREWDQSMKQWENEQQQLLGQMHKLQEAHQQMKEIVIEYERTISQLIGDREKDKAITNDSLNQLKKERDQALEDLQNVETAFADLHRRYEKCKTALETFKKNEEVLKNYVSEAQAKLTKQEQKYELLKSHAEEKLESANQEIDNLKRTTEAESAAIRAQLKKAEMKISGLEWNLEQKAKENAELTNICDELIAKVGHSNS